MKNRGFTLIELLVVISIISLLSSVVMASLNQSRAKAQEATIKQTLQSIKTQAELEYSKTGDYSTVENAITPMLDHINKNGGTATTTYSNISPINEGYKRYAVSVKFNSDPTKNWSVSDSGNAAVWDKTDTKIDGSSGSETMDWTNAQNACKNSGGRLPSIEELKALWNAYGKKPDTFTNVTFYRSSTEAITHPNAAFIIRSDTGVVLLQNKGNPYLTRCVR